MPKTCVAASCSITPADGISVFQFPKDPKLRSKWTKHVLETRANFKATETSVLCALHFRDEAFANLMPFKMGFASRLFLNDDARPTVHRKNMPQERLQYLKRQDTGQRDRGIVSTASVSTAEVASADIGSPKAILKLTGHRIINEYTVLKKKEEEEANRLSLIREYQAKLSKLLKTCDQNCQTDFPPDVPATSHEITTTTRGIQMPKRKPWVKNAGTQSKMVGGSNVCTQTEDQMDSSAEDEDEDAIGDIDADCKPPVKKSKFEAYDPVNSRYIIVEEKQLAELFLCIFCKVCHSQCSFTEVTGDFVGGTFYSVKLTCKKDGCSYSWIWKNQEVLGRMAVANLQMSAAILFSGVCVAKTERLFAMMKLKHISARTFFEHAKCYLHPLVLSVWKQNKSRMLTSEKYELQGDCRSDSPGHSAKYGTYVVAEANTGKILTFNVVQSNEVPSSYWCEIEGLKRIIEEIGDDRISILVTDRHSSW